LKIPQKIIYFHLNTLTDSGEEYASKTGNEIFVYQNPPKTKTEALYNSKETGIKGQLEAIDFMAKNGVKVSNYKNIIASMNILNTDYKELADRTDNFDAKLNVRFKTLESSISKMQVTIYPKLRKAFAEELKDKLWVEDIKVTYSGTSITLIGYIYAALLQAANNTIKINNDVFFIQFFLYLKLFFRFIEILYNIYIFIFIS
jgi:hypothetical protein